MAYNLENHYAAKHASVAFVLFGFAAVAVGGLVLGGDAFAVGCLLFAASCHLFAIWRDRRWPVSG